MLVRFVPYLSEPSVTPVPNLVQNPEEDGDLEHLPKPKKVKRRQEPELPMDPEEALRLKAEAASIAAEVFANAGSAAEIPEEEGTAKVGHLNEQHALPQTHACFKSLLSAVLTLCRTPAGDHRATQQKLPLQPCHVLSTIVCLTFALDQH